MINIYTLKYNWIALFTATGIMLFTGYYSNGVSHYTNGVSTKNIYFFSLLECHLDNPKLYS